MAREEHLTLSEMHKYQCQAATLSDSPWAARGREGAAAARVDEVKLLAGLARDKHGFLPACANGDTCWSDGCRAVHCSSDIASGSNLRGPLTALAYTSTHRHSSQQGGQSKVPGPGLGRASPCTDRASQSSESAGREQLVSGTCEVMPWRPSQLTTLTRLVQLRGGASNSGTLAYV